MLPPHRVLPTRTARQQGRHPPSSPSIGACDRISAEQTNGSAPIGITAGNAGAQPTGRVYLPAEVARNANYTSSLDPTGDIHLVRQCPKLSIELQVGKGSRGHEQDTTNRKQVHATPTSVHGSGTISIELPMVCVLASFALSAGLSLEMATKSLLQRPNYPPSLLYLNTRWAVSIVSSSGSVSYFRASSRLRSFAVGL